MAGDGRSLRLVLQLMVLVAFPASLYAHSEPPPPIPTPRPSPPPEPPAPKGYQGTTVKRVYPVRWSWVHWWEANRDEFLDRVAQSRGQKPDQQAIGQFRKAACNALIEAMKSGIPQLRGTAALALGQIGAADAEQKIIDLLKIEKEPAVRQYALVGLGLLGTPAAQKFLASTAFKTRQEQEAATVAMGLASQPSPEVLASLQKGAASGDISIATIAAWAASRHAEAGNQQFLVDLLKHAESPWQACDVIAAMRPSAKQDNTAMLVGLLTSSGSSSVTAARLLSSRIARTESVIAKAATGKGDAATYDQYREQFYRWRAGNCPNTIERPDPAKAGVTGLIFGLEHIYLARLRASAAIALGFHDNQASRQALVNCLQEKNELAAIVESSEPAGYSDVYKGQAMMSLGRLGEKAALPSLVGYVKPVQADGGRKSKDDLESPLRGYAALALGLYCRPIQTPQGPTDPENFDKVALLLGERMADRSEQLEVRTAAALALGLSGRTENLKYLQPASQNIGKNEEILGGFAILARGLLGDKNILDPARKLLAKANDNSTTSGIMARRAAVLGLGVLGSQEGVPVLVGAWDLSYHSNREICLAMAMCQAYNSTDTLVKMLKEASSPWERAYAARSLGELFNASRPQRLAVLVNGSNYTMRNNALGPYRMLANEFLFLELMPLFGDYWK